MSSRGFVVLALVLAALGLGWHQRDRLEAAWAAAPAIVRSAGGEAAGEARAPGKAGAGQGGALRKCVNGEQVAYTNVECPPGFKAQAVGGVPVTVLPATPVPRAAPPAAGGSAPSALHQALDLTRDDKLRDRIMQRAVEGPGP